MKFLVFEEFRDIYLHSLALEQVLSNQFEKDIINIKGAELRDILQTLERLSRTRMILAMSFLNLIGEEESTQLYEMIKPHLDRFMRRYKRY